MKLYYWQIKARSYAAMAVAQAGGISIEHTVDPKLTELRPELPFGQLPYLVDGDIKVAQSLAIVRYLARKGGLQGDTDKGFAFSEMLIQEMEDCFTLMAKANYVADKAAAYAETLAHDGPLAKQFGYLEKLHPGDGPFFNNQPGAKRVAGAYAIAAVLDIAVHLEPTVLDPFPKLKLFYTTIIADSAFDGIRDWNMYLSRT